MAYALFNSPLPVIGMPKFTIVIVVTTKVNIMMGFRKKRTILPFIENLLYREPDCTNDVVKRL